MRIILFTLLTIFAANAHADDATPEWYQQNIIPHKAPGTVIPSYTPAQPLSGVTPPQNRVVIQSTTSNGNSISQSSIVTGNGTSQSIIMNSSNHVDHHHHRVCNYNTVNGVLVNNPNIINSSDCTPPNTVFIPLYTGLPLAAPYATVTSQITDSVKGDEFVIDNNRIVFTNLWHGTCHQSDCSVTAGYLASNPLIGMIMMTQPALSKTPLLIQTPTSSGPVSVIAADMASGILTLQSQSGSYPIEDQQGNPAVEENGQQVVQTPGGEKYTFDIGKAKFVQP